MAELSRKIDARLGAFDIVLDLVVPPEHGKLVAWLYENTDVIARETGEDGAAHLKIRLAAEKRPRLDAQLKRIGLSTTV